MKHFFNRAIFLTLFILLAACGQSATPMPSPIPSPTMTRTATIVPTRTPTATAATEPTARPTYVRPTLIPTIEPTLLPELLQNTFSIEAMNLNAYNTRRITGWEHGFGTMAWYAYCPGYVWLDTNHFLLYPAAGQKNGPEGSWAGINVVPQPAVINLKSGAIWLPPVTVSSGASCNSVYWSRELEIMINPEVRDEVSMVSTYTYDGFRLSSYPGKISSISPTGMKILMADGTMLDLHANQKIELNWSLEDYREQYFPEDLFWTSDETRIYRCCYFYADLATGTSHRFERSDFQTVNGDRLKEKGLGFYRGQWVRDDTFFLVWWSYLDDGDIRYLPMFDPAEKILYDVREMAGISSDLTCPETDVSTDGKYLWIMCYEVNYLVNLFDFETTRYPGYTQVDIDWSSDSQFAWLADYYTSENNIEILSVANKELKSLPVAPLPESYPWWHPTDHILVYPAKDKNALIFLDASTMSYRELLFKAQDTRYKISNLVWSPNGDKLTFVTEDSVLWQVDYPALENLEQIIASVHTVSNVQWSPDGNSLAFVSGSDIFIVETTK